MPTGDLIFVIGQSDIQALTANITADPNDGLPPTDIIGIEGPYYDRMFALTTTLLYPSRQLKPETFNILQAITIGDETEVPYWIHKSIGGIFVGTSKTIRLLRGDGAELGDGRLDFILEDLNIGKPPVSKAVATDGNLIIYEAADGLRVLNGVQTELINGSTELLWRGEDRHGVTHVDRTGRTRMAINQGHLYVIVPEYGLGGGTGSPIIWRLNLKSGTWTRRIYPVSFMSIFSNPDGTLIAGDSTGGQWTLNWGTGDYDAVTDSQNPVLLSIPVTLQSKYFDDDKPLNRKDANDLTVFYDSDTQAATLALLKDGSATAAWTISHANAGTVPYQIDVHTAGTFRQMAFKLTGSFTILTFRGFSLSYRLRPPIAQFYENRPMSPDNFRNRFGGLDIMIDTLSQNAIVTPVLDGIDGTPVTINTIDALLKNVTFPSAVGRDLWARITSAVGFELFGIAPIVLQDKVQIIRGYLPSTDAGYPGIKVINGTTVRVCTMGVARLFTAVYDGTLDTQSFSATTAVGEYQTFVFNPVDEKHATECGLYVNGDVELENWHPNVMYRLPIPCRIWDTGYVDLGRQEITWPSEIKIKVNATANLDVVCYFDDVAFATISLTVTAGVFSVYRINVPITYKGFQPRFVVTAHDSSEFSPEWIAIKYRGSGKSNSDEKQFLVRPTQTQ